MFTTKYYELGNWTVDAVQTFPSSTALNHNCTCTRKKKYPAPFSLTNCRGKCFSRAPIKASMAHKGVGVRLRFSDLVKVHSTYCKHILTRGQTSTTCLVVFVSPSDDAYTLQHVVIIGRGDHGEVQVKFRLKIVSRVARPTIEHAVRQDHNAVPQITKPPLPKLK